MTGRGTGIDDATLARKIDVVRRAAALVVVQGAARGLQDVATFDAAGVVDKTGD